MAYFFDILAWLLSALPTATQRQPNANPTPTQNYRISIELYSFGRNVSSVLSASK